MKKKTNPHRVERGEDGLVRRVKEQSPKQQLQILSVKGILLGTISLKTPVKDVLELMKNTRHYSSFWVNKNDERIHEYDVLRMDFTEFPVSAWMFPDSESIKKGVFEDLPF